MLPVVALSLVAALVMVGCGSSSGPRVGPQDGSTPPRSAHRADRPTHRHQPSEQVPAQALGAARRALVTHNASAFTAFRRLVYLPYRRSGPSSNAKAVAGLRRAAAELRLASHDAVRLPAMARMGAALAALSV